VLLSTLMRESKSVLKYCTRLCGCNELLCTHLLRSSDVEAGTFVPLSKKRQSLRKKKTELLVAQSTEQL
jgi:hypothetical protein